MIIEIDIRQIKITVTNFSRRMSAWIAERCRTWRIPACTSTGWYEFGRCWKLPEWGIKLWRRPVEYEMGKWRKIILRRRPSRQWSHLWRCRIGKIRILRRGGNEQWKCGSGNDGILRTGEKELGILEGIVLWIVKWTHVIPKISIRVYTMNIHMWNKNVSI